MDIYKTKLFSKWFLRLKDAKAKAIINARIRKIELNGNMGDHKTISNKIMELRFDCGPGYRIYLIKEGYKVVLLLLGGDKDSQDRDIQKAEEMAKNIRPEDFLI